MDEEENSSFELIANIIHPDTIHVINSPNHFAHLMGPGYVQLIQQFVDMNSLEFFNKLCEQSPDFSHHAPPFVIFSGRVGSKKAPLKWILISTPTFVYTYDPETDVQTKSEFVAESVVLSKKFNAIRVIFPGGSNIKFYFDTTDKHIVFELVDSFLKFEMTNQIKLLIKSLLISPSPPIFNVFRKHIQEMFTQNDFLPIRSLYFTPFDCNSNKEFAAALVKIHTKNNSLPFYLNVIISIYFQDPPKGSQLLRGDSLLTNSLAAIREIFAPNYYDELIDKLKSRLEENSTKEDLFNLFFTVVKEVEVPRVLEWLCWLIFQEANRVEPDSDAPYIAVSSFFFFRALGPKIVTIKDPKLRNKIKELTNLINFKDSEESSRFIPRLKDLIKEMSSNFHELEVQKFPEEEVNDSTHDIIRILTENADLIQKHLEKHLPVGKNPIHYFIERQLELVKDMKYGMNC